MSRVVCIASARASEVLGLFFFQEYVVYIAFDESIIQDETKQDGYFKQQTNIHKLIVFVIRLYFPTWLFVFQKGKEGFHNDKTVPQ